MDRPKRVAAIHDLSSFGRCSLSVIVPILSVQGIQVCSVPTAVLSTHTGGFQGFVMQDLNGYISSCLKHWINTGVEVECVYSGFLSGAGQIEEVQKYFHAYQDALKVVDPVLGDNGVPYQTVDQYLIASMKDLVTSADIITPNTTEVALLLNIDYDPKALEICKAKEILETLAAMGPRQVVITGQEIKKEGICNLCYDAVTQQYHLHPCNYFPAHYPGTGDVFTSVMTGRIMKGATLYQAMASATEFVEQAIQMTYSSKDPKREGVFLEAVLPLLLKDEVSDRIRKI